MTPKQLRRYAKRLRKRQKRMRRWMFYLNFLEHVVRPLERVYAPAIREIFQRQTMFYDRFIEYKKRGKK